MRRWWIGVLLALVVVLLVACSGASAGGAKQAASAETMTEGIYLIDAASVRRTSSPPAEGDQAPDFTFVSEDGKEFSLRDFHGHPVVINFWATWCPPCRMEMPALDQAYHAHKDNGLVMLAVEEMDKRADVLAFRQQMNVSLPMLLDTQGLVGRTYMVRGLPTTFFIDGEGRVVIRWTGMLTEESLQKNLQVLFERSG